MGILKIPRISTADRISILLLEGELVYDTTSGDLYKGDGVTVGGILIASSSGDISSVITTITVSENILIGQLVNGDGSKADSDIVGKRDWGIGIADSAINSGFSGNIITEGYILNVGWSFTAGNIIYLNGTSLSSTVPSTGFIQKIGVAISPTEIEIDIQNAILI